MWNAYLVLLCSWSAHTTRRHRRRNVNPFCAECILENIKTYPYFLSFHNRWRSWFELFEVPSWIRFLMTCLSCKVNTMAADDLVTQGARASVAMVLTQFWNSVVSASEGLTLTLHTERLQRNVNVLLPFQYFSTLIYWTYKTSLPISHDQYLAYWPGDIRSQGISKQGIEPLTPGYSIISTIRVENHISIACKVLSQLLLIRHF